MNSFIITDQPAETINLGQSTPATSPNSPSLANSMKQAANPLAPITSHVIGAFPFTDTAKQSLAANNYHPADYSKSSIVPNQGGQYNVGTNDVSITTNNSHIPVDQQHLVMAHEMLNSLYPKSPAAKQTTQFNAAWNRLKTTHPDQNVRTLLSDIDSHMERLGYPKLGKNVMNSSRFSYLAQDALTEGSKWIPKELQPYYKGIINF